MKKLCSIVIIILILSSSNALSAPAISGVTAGWSDGDSETISGSAFGTNALDIQRSRAFDDVITVKIDNLLEITNKIATRQERILDRLMDAYNTSEK